MSYGVSSVEAAKPRSRNRCKNCNPRTRGSQATTTMPSSRREINLLLVNVLSSARATRAWTRFNEVRLCTKCLQPLVSWPQAPIRTHRDPRSRNGWLPSSRSSSAPTTPRNWPSARHSSLLDTRPSTRRAVYRSGSLPGCRSSMPSCSSVSSCSSSARTANIRVTYSSASGRLPASSRTAFR